NPGGRMPKEIYGQKPSQSGFPIAPIRGPFPDGDRQVDQSGTRHCRRNRRPPNSSRRERGGAAILPVKLASQKTGSIACLEHSRAWACSLKAETAGSSLRAWESCFEATILRALQGTRVLSLMTARGGPGDSLAIA